MICWWHQTGCLDTALSLPTIEMTLFAKLWPFLIHQVCRAWGASVDCSSGYLTNVIEMLGAAVAKKSWMSDVVLIVHAMSLCKVSIICLEFLVELMGKHVQSDLLIFTLIHAVSEKTSFFVALLHFRHALYNTEVCTDCVGRHWELSFKYKKSYVWTILSFDIDSP